MINFLNGSSSVLIRVAGDAGLLLVDSPGVVVDGVEAVEGVAAAGLDLSLLHQLGGVGEPGQQEEEQDVVHDWTLASSSMRTEVTYKYRHEYFMKESKVEARNQ